MHRRFGTLALTLTFSGLLAGAARAQETAPTSLGFVSPRDQSTVLGPSQAELQLDLPAGVEAVEVSLSVDGKRVGSLSRHPWRFSWDAGDGNRGHRLEAEARLSNGSVLRAAARTMPLRILQVEDVDLVDVYAIVRDGDGQYVKGLERDALRVFDNGRLQTIDRFSSERRPLRLGIVLDNSRSMGEEKGNKIEAAREAATDLLGSLEPGDEAFLITFSDYVKVAQELTSDRAKLAAVIEKVEVEAGTALYDALWRASEVLDPYEGRKVVVLLSDGRDEASNGIEPGSLHTFEETLDRALRSEVTVFTVGVGKDLEHKRDFHGTRTLASILVQVAEATGGRAFISVSARRIRTSFEEVADDLRNQYFLAYAPPNLKRDGSWHEIRVTATRPGLVVAARKGYYAPRGGDD